MNNNASDRSRGRKHHNRGNQHSGGQPFVPMVPNVVQGQGQNQPYPDQSLNQAQNFIQNISNNQFPNNQQFPNTVTDAPANHGFNNKPLPPLITSAPELIQNQQSYMNNQPMRQNQKIGTSAPLMSNPIPVGMSQQGANPNYSKMNPQEVSKLINATNTLVSNVNAVKAMVDNLVKGV